MAYDTWRAQKAAPSAILCSIGSPNAQFDCMASKISHTTSSTTDHQQIRKWAEERGAKPACFRGTGGKHDVGMIRLDFPGYSGEDKLQPISWDEWFEKFDERQLALLYQDETASGEMSNFNKLVGRENVS